MAFLDDAGTWVVVALATIPFGTWLCARKTFHRRLRFENLLVAGVFWAECVLPGWSLLGSGPKGSCFLLGIPWPVVVPMLCGTCLAVGAKDVLRAFAWSFLGIVVGTVLILPGLSCVAGMWIEECPSDVLKMMHQQGSDRPDAPKLSAGFVDELGERSSIEDGEIDSEVFRLAVVHPLWHSGITGITDSKVERYRLWAPAGTQRERENGARLVPLDGNEKPTGPGIPADSSQLDAYGLPKDPHVVPGLPVKEFPLWCGIG